MALQSSPAMRALGTPGHFSASSMRAGILIVLLTVMAEPAATLDVLPSPMALPQTPDSQEGMMESARLYGNINKYAYYFTDLLIGWPNQQRTSVIVDTGSRIAGFPCKGCQHCGAHIDPAFDINGSKSAAWLPCGHDCKDSCVNGQCTYKETYSEGSSIIGRWFHDEVELGDAFNKNPSVRARLGCHTCEDQLFYTQRANGIMGLAPASSNEVDDKAPTVLQDLFRDKKHVRTEMFSMCLASWGGRLTVGGYNSWYHEEKVHWLPMHASKYYYVFPHGLSLMPPEASRQQDGEEPEFAKVNVTLDKHDFGVTIVDSGTTYTYFPGPLFNSLISSLTSYCSKHDGCGAQREGSECWRLREASRGPEQFPRVRLAFEGEASVMWSPEGYLHERSERGVWCQTFMENNLYQTVLGISWMLHKDIIFDLSSAQGRLGVAKAKCPEHHREDEFQEKYTLAKERVRTQLAVPRRRSVGERLLHHRLGEVAPMALSASAALLLLLGLLWRRSAGRAAFSESLPAAEETGEDASAGSDIPILGSVHQEGA